MSWWQITFNSSLGNVTIDNFVLLSDETTRDVALDRPPYSEEFFLTGNLQELGTLTFSIRPLLRKGHDAMLEKAALEDILNNVRSVTWNGHTRDTYGAEGNISTAPTEKFFNFTFTLPCKAPWTKGDGNVIDPATCLVISPTPTIENAYSVHGDFPQESYSYSRQIEMASYGLRQRGDLGRNASTLIVPLSVNTGNDADTWATALHIESLVKNIEAINFNNNERRVGSWRRIARRYEKCAIKLTLEFLMKDRAYPGGPKYLSFSDGDIVQLENNNLVIVG